MSTDFEQRLRAEIEQVAVRPRPGLVKEAYRSYLPVQLAGTEATSGPKPAAVLIHFRWLPPTRANLAQLTGTIPPGFHRTYPR